MSKDQSGLICILGLEILHSRVYNVWHLMGVSVLYISIFERLNPHVQSYESHEVVQFIPQHKEILTLDQCIAAWLHAKKGRSALGRYNVSVIEI
jgi:hypothetical protein